MVIDRSRDEALVGQNVSYENSFSKVKKDIFKETVQKNKAKGYQVEDVIVEKPPKQKPQKILKAQKASNANSVLSDSGVAQEYMVAGHPSAKVSKNKAEGSSRTNALGVKKASTNNSTYNSTKRAESKEGNASVSSGKSAGYNTTKKT